MRKVTQSVGRLVVGSALHVLAAEQRSRPADVSTRLRAGDRRLHARLRFLVARQLRLALRGDHPNLRDLRLFGSALGQEVRPTSDLDLLVHVAERDPALENAVLQIAQEASAAYRDLMADSVGPGFELVSLHVVTDADVETGQGYGALVRGAHAPSLRIDA